MENEWIAVGKSRWLPETGEVKLVEDRPIEVEFDDYEFRSKVPDENNYSCIWIKDTRRAFVGERYSAKVNGWHIENNDEIIAVVEDFQQAWSIEEEPFIEASKKYGIDFHIFGWECGMQFHQEIEIVKGNVLTNIVDEYDTNAWDNPMPSLGG